MENRSLSVEELSISFSDNQPIKPESLPEKDFLKEEEDDEIDFEKPRKNFPEKVPKIPDILNKTKGTIGTKPNGQRIPSKYSPLPSLGHITDRSLVENYERNREQQDAVWTLCTALHVPSKELSRPVSASDTHLPKCTKSRTVLAPLRDKKQRPHSQHDVNESSRLHEKPRKTDKEEDETVHFTPISKHPDLEQEKCLQTTGEKSHELGALRPKPRFLSPTQDLNEDVSGLNRRFSMPVSPRLLRRFNKEKLYSSQQTEGAETELSRTHPERGSTFSPTFNNFDSLQNKDDEAISKDFIKLNAGKRENRRSLDLNFDANSMRFLSEIKVSLGKEPSSENIFAKAKPNPEKRKNSYSLSNSSETILKDCLPEVFPKSNLQHAQPGSRNRASTFTSLDSIIPFETKTLGKSSLEAPMFLDAGTRRLSHLSLSPRLSRKR